MATTTKRRPGSTDPTTPLLDPQGRPRRFMTMGEAADLCGSTFTLIRSAVQREDAQPGTGLRAIHLGRLRRIHPADLEEWLGRPLGFLGRPHEDAAA